MILNSMRFIRKKKTAIVLRQVIISKETWFHKNLANTRKLYIYALWYYDKKEIDFLIDFNDI